MSFVEYFSFVTGCFGTWLGISFMSINFNKVAKMISKAATKHKEITNKVNKERRREEKLDYLFRVTKQADDQTSSHTTSVHAF